MWGMQLLLVTAYLLNKTSHLLIWKKDKRSMLSLYEFCCQLVLDWLGGSSNDNVSLLNIKQGRKYNSKSSSASADSSKKAKRVNNNLLDPYSGALSMRLDLDLDFHFSVLPNTKYPVCSLCRWAEDNRDIRVRGASIIACGKCHVSLCTTCFKPFHQVADVKQLQYQVLKNKEEMK